MENKENKNKENKNNEESFKSKKSNIIIPIIIAIIILLILLLSIKSCSSNEKDPVNDDVVEESVDEVFSIDFIVDGSVYYIIETAGNSNLTFPQDPVVAGYDFIDWYFEDSFDTVFTNTSYKNVKLEENIEVYAKFEAITYSITYIDEFNQTNNNQSSIAENESLTLVDLDEYEDNDGYGYRFLGWFLDEDCTEYVDTLSNITGDISLYSSYEKYSIGLEYLDWSSYVLYGIGTVKHTDIYVPSEINGKKVDSIMTQAFQNNRDITSIVFHEGMTNIDNDAFVWCSSLKSVKLPESLTRIGSNAFSGCIALTDITLPDSLTEIAWYAFKDCRSLTSITIPHGITHIDNYTFYGCTSLASITMPDTLTSIGTYVFYNCSALTSINLPDSITSIGNAAIAGCISLTSITIDPNNSYFKVVDGDLYTTDGTMLVAYAAGDMETTFTVPDGVTSIGFGVFFGCSYLTSITIPDGVTSLNDYTFADCTSLTSITMPNSVTNLGMFAFKNCTALASVTMSNTLTDISRSTFENCTALTSITIPSTITSIGLGAFSGCTALTITFDLTLSQVNSKVTLGTAWSSGVIAIEYK